MSTFAAVMTGQGTGAISTIEVFGKGAGAMIEKIFRPADGGTPALEAGKVLVGLIADEGQTIDQVVIGCEGANDFAINCHGNPLIVEMIMELLHRHGAEPITAEQLLAKELIAQGSLNTIAIEAKLAQINSMTLEGTKIILNQIEGGLNEKAAQWLEQIGTIPVEQIRAEAAQILSDSRAAKLIISGCTAAIAGPPNSGKSTLLNYLCGKQKAIVTDIRGTTRDWVSAQCKIGPLSVELIDTAGLDERFATGPDSSAETASQQKAVEILEEADLVLLLLDNSDTEEQLADRLLQRIEGKKVLTVLNKSDLPERLDSGSLPETLHDAVRISAKFGTGIENLVKKIPQICGTAGFDSNSAVCVSERQENLLKQLHQAQSMVEAVRIIRELLNGPLNV